MGPKAHTGDPGGPGTDERDWKSLDSYLGFTWTQKRSGLLEVRRREEESGPRRGKGRSSDRRQEGCTMTNTGGIVHPRPLPRDLWGVRGIK